MADNIFTETWKEAGHIDIMGRQVTRINPPKRCVNIYLEPAYLDWRMYMSNYYLYLPYVGVISIDSERYVGHTLGIDLFFDIRTGNLKYNILSDNVLMESHEGSCRVNLPVSGGSPLQAAKEKIGGLAELAYQGGVAIGSGGANIAKGVMTGNPLEGAKGLYNIIKPTPKNSTGGFSPSTAIQDSLHIYLMVETPEIYFGDGIQSRYGYPDNRFVSLGSVSGYVEVGDVELRTRATETEQNEILALLMQGVII